MYSQEDRSGRSTSTRSSGRFAPRSASAGIRRVDRPLGGVGRQAGPVAPRKNSTFSPREKLHGGVVGRVALARHGPHDAVGVAPRLPVGRAVVPAAVGVYHAARADRRRGAPEHRGAEGRRGRPRRGAQAAVEELELRNAVLEGTIEILKKDPGADLSALTAAERAALAESLAPRSGLPRALAALLAAEEHLLLPALGPGRATPTPRSRAADSFEASGGAAPGACGPPCARGAARPQRARRAAHTRPGAARGRLGEGRAARHARGGALRPRGPRAARLQLLRRRGGPALRAQPAAGRRGPATCTTSRRALPGRSWSPTSPSSGSRRPREVYLSPLVDLFDGGLAPSPWA